MRIKGQVQPDCPAGMVDTARIGAAFGLRPQLVSAWAKQGKIPPASMRVGKKLFWPESVIDELRARFAAAVDVRHDMKQEAA